MRDRDHANDRAAKTFIEHMWSLCSDFLDSGLRQRARSNFSTAFWELYLAFALFANGVHLVPRKERRPAKSGPDLLIREPPIWIEAVAPGLGEGADRVPDFTGIPGAHTVPDEQLKLRLRSAIEEKYERLLAYEKGDGYARTSRRS